MSVDRNSIEYNLLAENSDEVEFRRTKHVNILYKIIQFSKLCGNKSREFIELGNDVLLVALNYEI